MTALLNKELQEQVHDAINQLSERKRQCILLYYGRSMNLSEVARVFGLTPSRISQILSTARKELKGHLLPVALSHGFFVES
jgi:RNA polymerase sigma factor for flagellar operon FliA